MGGEIGQWAEWDHDSSVQWHLLGQPFHDGVRRWVAHLNRLHSEEPALHELDFDSAGFEWVDFRDSAQSVISFLRLSAGGEIILAVFNFTPVPRRAYRVGAPRPGAWREIANGDEAEFGGSGSSGARGVDAEPVPRHGRPFSLVLDLAPLAAIFLKAPAVPALPAKATGDPAVVPRAEDPEPAPSDRSSDGSSSGGDGR
jgi:1,4-alpha-glucan branching enzyme